MQYTSIRFSKTVQVSQYEPETVELMATLEDNDELKASLDRIRREAYEAFGKRFEGAKVETVVTTDSRPVEAEVKADKPTKKASEGKATRKTRTRNKPKVVKYDRASDAHKTEFAGVLNREVPEWKASSETKLKAKDLSGHLNGEDFLDAKGKVLESFVTAVVDGMVDDL